MDSSGYNLFCDQTIKNTKENIDKKENSSDDKNNGETKISLTKRESDNQTENSPCERKRAKYIADHIDKNKNETTNSQTVNNTSGNAINVHKECSREEKYLVDGIKIAEQEAKFYMNGKSENKKKLTGQRNNGENLIKIKNEEKLYVKSGNDFMHQNIVKHRNVEDKIETFTQSKEEFDYKTKYVDRGNQKYINEDQNYKFKTSTIQVDNEELEIKVEDKFMDHNPKKVVCYKKKDNIDTTKKTEIKCEKTETEQIDVNNVKTEQEDNCNTGTTDIDTIGDHLSIQTFHLTLIFLDIRKKLYFKFKQQDPSLFENTNLGTVTRTNYDEAEAVRISKIFSDNAFSSVLLRNVTFVYNYFRKYFRNIDIRESKYFNAVLEAKARKFIIKRYCYAFYTCYQKMPSHILLPNLNIDVEYSKHLVKEAKKLANDSDFDETLFLEIINSFINFLIKYRKKSKSAVSQHSSIDPMQQAGTFNIEPDRNSNHSIPLTFTNVLSSICASISARKNRNHTVTSTETETENDLDTVAQLSPPPLYSSTQHGNYYNPSQPMVLKNVLQQRNEFIDQSLPDFVQYDPFNEMYTSRMERARPLVSRHEGFMSPIGLGYNDQMMQLTNNNMNPSQMMYSAPINFSKNAVAACLVCKRDTTRRCEGCFSIFVCSKVCELAILNTHHCFCKHQST